MSDTCTLLVYRCWLRLVCAGVSVCCNRRSTDSKALRPGPYIPAWMCIYRCMPGKRQHRPELERHSYRTSECICATLPRSSPGLCILSRRCRRRQKHMRHCILRADFTMSERTSKSEGMHRQAMPLQHCRPHLLRSDSLQHGRSCRAQVAPATQQAFQSGRAGCVSSPR